MYRSPLCHGATLSRLRLTKSGVPKRWISSTVETGQGNQYATGGSLVTLGCSSKVRYRDGPNNDYSLMCLPLTYLRRYSESKVSMCTILNKVPARLPRIQCLFQALLGHSLQKAHRFRTNFRGHFSLHPFTTKSFTSLVYVWRLH